MKRILATACLIGFAGSSAWGQTQKIDFDGSGSVDLADYLRFADHFGGQDPTCDLDHSGTVDFTDFFFFADLFSLSVESADEPLLGQTLTANLPGGATMEFVWIEPGTFVMGSPDSEEDRQDDEGPQHEVTISRGFWLGKYELTKGQWEAVMDTTPWFEHEELWGPPDLDEPASYISWNDVQFFVQKLNTAEGDSLYRLPTEAEWEYACRAGTTTWWSFGDDENQLGEYAWYDGNAGRVHPVGMKRPNPWGLYNMHGNVGEWCQDRYGVYSRGVQTDPTGPERGYLHVIRGGNYWDPASTTRPAYRNNRLPSESWHDIGARLVRLAKPAVLSNRAPEADAGGGQIVDLGTAVQLDGRGSIDTDGDGLTYRPRPNTRVTSRHLTCPQ